MNILIPMSDGRKIHSKTYKSLAMQTIECDIIPITRPVISGSLCSGQVINMNLLRQYAEPPYSIYMDDDVCLTSSTDIEDCLRFLEQNTQWDAVALDTKGDVPIEVKRDHVVCAFFMVRHQALSTYTFCCADPMACQCADINKNLRIRYLDDRQLYEVGHK